MRKLMFVSALLAFAFASMAQDSKPNVQNCPEGCKPEQFLDEVFVEGRATKTNMEVSSAYFNYSLMTNSIVYILPDKVIYLLSDINDYSQITYGNRTFIPFGKKEVAEVLKTFSDGTVLLLERKTRENDKVEGAYGVSSNTASVQKVNYFVENSGIYIPSKFINLTEYVFSKNYHLRINGKVQLINTKKKIKKIFPQKADIIDAEYKKDVRGETEEERYIRIISACVE